MLNIQVPFIEILDYYDHDKQKYNTINNMTFEVYFQANIVGSALYS